MDWPELGLPIAPPYPPMEARLLAETLPAGEGWQLEPKWDGFRCLAYKDRYFPELVQALEQLAAPRFILDGEIVTPVPGGFSFEDLLQRIHPAASRVRRLAAERPAALLAFDLLADERGRALVDQPLSARRAGAGAVRVAVPLGGAGEALSTRQRPG